MPKEIVVGGTLSNEDGSDATQGLVQLGWSPEVGHVQIVTFARDPVSFDEKWKGYFVDLTRRDINQLIRYLRRARDQSFGRDE